MGSNQIVYKVMNSVSLKFASKSGDWYGPAKIWFNLEWAKKKRARMQAIYGEDHVVMAYELEWLGSIDNGKV